MNINTALDYFIASCKLRGLSDRTIECYSSFVGRYVATQPGKTIEDLTYNAVSDYINFLYSADISRATVATYLRHLKVFIRWLEEEKYIGEPFSIKIKVPKTPKKVLRIYNDDEIKQIFSAIDIQPEWIRHRNCSIVALMLDSGLRQNEVCKICTPDIQIRESMMKVHGKGNKERIVPIGKLSMQFINSYLKKCPHESTTLFVTNDGKPLTKNTVKLFIHKLEDKLGFEFSSHKLRHNFATNYCLDQYEKHGQVDIYKLMVLLGHEDILTTRRYLHVATQIIASKNNISHIDKVLIRTP